MNTKRKGVTGMKTIVTEKETEKIQLTWNFTGCEEKGGEVKANNVVKNVIEVNTNGEGTGDEYSGNS